jgi:RNA polymerase sigma factor (sigma-70 family)
VVDRTSNELIYEKYADELVRFATFLVGPSDAADVLSGAMVRALSSSSWETVANHRAYLYRAVLNEARMAARTEGRRRYHEQRAALDIPVEPTTPRPEVLAAVATLSPRQRAVVFLTYWEDLDPTSIGEVLGISDGGVRRHLARGRKKLRRLLHA